MKKTTWIALAFAAAVIGYLVISSFQPKPFRCKVCITFHGAQVCRIASADSQMDARRTATTNACAELTSGVTLSTQCENTPPDSVEWLK